MIGREPKYRIFKLDSRNFVIEERKVYASGDKLGQAYWDESDRSYYISIESLLLNSSVQLPTGCGKDELLKSIRETKEELLLALKVAVDDGALREQESEAKAKQREAVIKSHDKKRETKAAKIRNLENIVELAKAALAPGGKIEAGALEKFYDALGKFEGTEERESA